VGSVAPSLFQLHCAVSAVGAYSAQTTFSGTADWDALLATYRAAPEPPAPGPAGQTPTGSQSKPDSGCKRLRRKLKRQKRNLARADSESKRAQIERNIEDTKRRLGKRGC
jgi:hypothetical protein